MKRQEAYDNNLKFYQSDKPCAQGHTADRYVSTGNCTECQKKYGASYAKGKKYDVKKFGTKNILHLLNMVVVTYRIAPEDRAELDAYAAALNMQRDLNHRSEVNASRVEFLTASSPMPTHTTD